jgi:hypothetical protein
MDKLVTQLLKGLKTDKRREDSYVLRVDKKIVAEVLIRPKRGVRANFRDTAAKPAEATKSAKQWASFVYVTDENLAAVRKLIETAIAAEVQTVANATAKPVAKRTRKSS